MLASERKQKTEKALEFLKNKPINEIERLLEESSDEGKFDCSIFIDNWLGEHKDLIYQVFTDKGYLVTFRQENGRDTVFIGW